MGGGVTCPDATLGFGTVTTPGIFSRTDRARAVLASLPCDLPDEVELVETTGPTEVAYWPDAPILFLGTRLDDLNDAQFAGVLAHEAAHLHLRHHRVPRHVMALTYGPGLPTIMVGCIMGSSAISLTGILVAVLYFAAWVPVTLWMETAADRQAGHWLHGAGLASALQHMHAGGAGRGWRARLTHPSLTSRVAYLTSIA